MLEGGEHGTGKWHFLASGLVSGVPRILGPTLRFVWSLRQLFLWDSNWARWAKRFPANSLPEGPIYHRQTVVMGAVLYKNCTTVVLSSLGLYLRIPLPRHPAVLIPWRELAGVQPTRLNWKPAIRLSFCEAQSTEINLWARLAELIPHLCRPVASVAPRPT